VERCIAHLDIDAFYASVELLRRPELRGRPVIVSGSGPRAVVTTASYEARRFGVGSAMPTSRALRQCPDAVLIAPDFVAYRQASRQVMDLVRATGAEVEQAGLDEAYLDLSGMLSPRAAMRRLVNDIHGRTGLTASVGMGPNKLVAKVCSDAEKPRGFVVLTREQARERFRDARPGLVPGIGPKTAERLEKLGIATLGRLAEFDEEALAAALGPRHGRDLIRRARFEHDGEVTSVRVAKSESRETTFDSDVADAAELEAIMARLAGELCARLVEQHRRGRTLSIKVRLDDWTTVTRARSVAQATNDAAVVREVALELLRAYAPPRPVRLLGVQVAGLDRADAPPAAEADQLALPV
jgi:DNA polymerase IV